MNSDTFSYPVNRGRAIIRRSRNHRSGWELVLQTEGRELLIAGGFAEPQEAASCAYKKDFHHDAAREWGGRWVPDLINDWNPFLPDPPPETPSRDRPLPDCGNRPGQPKRLRR